MNEKAYQAAGDDRKRVLQNSRMRNLSGISSNIRQPV
nr:MAG TPA: hypothetical protein [Caudoviricetes sp.]